MSLSVIHKHKRVEKSFDAQSSKNSFSRLPESIISLISNNLNIKDVESLTCVCKRFRLIFLNYFLNAHSEIQSCFEISTFTSREILGLDAFPVHWKTGLERALPKLKVLELHGSSWESDICMEKYEGLPENQILRILSLAQSLKKLYLIDCSTKVLKYASSIKLTELNLTINHDLDYSLLNKSLIKLSIESDQKVLSIINFDHDLHPLPYLETLTIKEEGSYAETTLSNEFQIFISRLTSLKKLEITGSNLYINMESFIHLKNLKELTLYKNIHQTVILIKSDISSLEILTIHDLVLDLLDFQNFRDKIISLKQLQKVNLIYSFNSIKEKLCYSGIASLDNVMISFVKNYVPNKLDYNIKNLSISNYDLCRLSQIVENDNNIHQNDDDLDCDLNSIITQKLEILFRKTYTHKNGMIYEDGIGKVYFNNKLITHNEYCIILGLKFLSTKITSIKDEGDFVWTKSLIAHLKQNPLINCTSLTGKFLYEDKTPIPTRELLSFFPNLNPEKIDRTWVDRYSWQIE